MHAIRTEFVPGSPRLASDRAGRGPLVVLLHGIGGNRLIWRSQLAALADDFHAVAWDARGYGDSEDYDGPLDFADFSRDLLRLLDHVGATRAHLIGQSMGGRIAQDFYMFHPERVATLTLVATFSGHEPEKSPGARAEYLRIRKEPLLAGKTPADIAPEIARNIVSPAASPEAYSTMVDSISRLHRDSYLKTLDGMIGYARKSDLEAIKAPTFLVYGADDRVTPARLGYAMARRIPDVEFLLVEGSGHMINVEQPETFNRAMLGFLRRHQFRAY